jgi:hypothetical protein
MTDAEFEKLEAMLDRRESLPIRGPRRPKTAIDCSSSLDSPAVRAWPEVMVSGISLTIPDKTDPRRCLGQVCR